MIKNITKERINGKFKMKKQKGITLIALVITIIVLLILAGVSINLVIGENGILEKAKNAADLTKSVTVQEAVEMAITNAKIDFFTTKMDKAFYEYLTYDIFEEQLEKNGYKMIADKNDISTPYNAFIEDSSIESVTGEYDNIVYITNMNETSQIYAVELIVDQENSSNVSVGEIVAVNTTFASTLTPANYGESIEYEANGVNDWKIFYADEIHVYIISSYYVDVTDMNNDSFPFTSYGYGIVERNTSGFYSGTEGARFAKALVDHSKWSNFVDESVANYAIGSPTLRMFLSSYNQVYNFNMKIEGNKAKGYKLNWNDNTDRSFSTTNSLYVITDTPSTWGMWLSTEYEKPDYPAYCFSVWYNGSISTQQVWKNCSSIRPVVCLKTNCIGEQSIDENGNRIWKLK